jgi:hypothetical protein
MEASAVVEASAAAVVFATSFVVGGRIHPLRTV